MASRDLPAALLSILEDCEGPQVKGSGCVWRIDGHSAATEDSKTKLLNTICSRNSAFVHHDEGVEDFPHLHALTRLTSNKWLVPVGTPGSALKSWLKLGNWTLYVAETLIASIPDLCRSSDREVEEFITKSGTAVIVDSFHDDDLWVIGIPAKP